MTEVSPDIRLRERPVLLVLAAAQFINIVDFIIVMPLGPRLMRTLDIDPQQFGLIVSAYTFAAAAAGLMAALFIDRFDRKAAFLTVFAGFSLGTICCALAPDYPLLLAARAATGAFGGVLGGMAMTIVGDVFPDERRGAATGMLMSAFALASVAGVPLGLIFGSWFADWHAPFWMLGIPSLIVLALGSRLLPRMRDHLNGQRPSALREIYATVGRGIHLQAFALVMVLVSGSFMVVPYLSAFFVANVGIREQSLPWIYVVGGAVTLFSSQLVGRLADRMGRFSLFCALASASGLMMLGVTMLPPAPLAVAAAATACLMVANSGRMIVAMTMINACVEPRRRGSFMSLSSSVQHLASGIGAYIGGVVIGRSASGELTGFGIVGLAAGLTALASIALATGLRPRSATEPVLPVELEIGLALCPEVTPACVGSHEAA